MSQRVLSHRRPVGVIVLAFLYLLTGVLSLFLLLYLIIFVAVLQMHLPASMNILEVSFVLVEGLASLIIGIGLWQVQRWAFWASVLKEGVFIIGSLVLLLLFSRVSYQLTQIVYSMIILVYLGFSKSVHNAFLSSDTPKST